MRVSKPHPTQQPTTSARGLRDGLQVTFSGAGYTAEAFPLPLMWQWANLPDTSSDGWSVWYRFLLEVADPEHFPRLIKCRACPILNYLNLWVFPVFSYSTWHLHWDALDNAPSKPYCRMSLRFLTQTWRFALTECFQPWLFERSPRSKHLMN